MRRWLPSNHLDAFYHYVDVLVSHVRKKLGADVIVNERGRGYRLGRAVS